MRIWRVGMAQINTTVGDLEGNVAKIRSSLQLGREMGADLVALPELAITGYPPEDLLLKPRFVEENRAALLALQPETRGLTAIVGFVDADQDIYNAAAVLHDGKLLGIYHKIYLPNYGVFDEDRYFRAGRECPVFVIAGVTLGVTICEDLWYATGPLVALAEQGAELVVNINSSPFHAGKIRFREKLVATRAADNSLYVAYVNLVGGQDELVFDGNSLLVNESGELIARGGAFTEELVLADIDLDAVFRHRLHDPRLRKGQGMSEARRWDTPLIVLSQEHHSRSRPPLPPRPRDEVEGPAESWAALVMGTRDYVRKNGFSTAFIGLSGGIDSSLVAAIAAEALGSENVIGISMPSHFSSEGSTLDAQLLARNLGIRLHIIPIADTYFTYERMLDPLFRETPFGIAEENLQSRIRGNILMAMTNKFGGIVLTTGNKSEMACGYATLYGDMSGGLAVIKDVPKTLVYQLARYCNARAGLDLIPQAVLEKEPTAELRPNQKDTDSLPPYDVLDPILQAYVEEDQSTEEIVAAGWDPDLVRRVIAMVDRNEYKRRQAPPGIRITPRNFGRDRRMPITNRYRP